MSGVTGNPVNFNEFTVDDTFFKHVENTVNITITDTVEPATPQFEYTIKESDLELAKPIIGLASADKQKWLFLSSFFLQNNGVGEIIDMKLFKNDVEVRPTSHDVGADNVLETLTEWGDRDTPIKAGDKFGWKFWSPTASNFQLQNTDIWFIPVSLLFDAFLTSFGNFRGIGSFWDDFDNAMLSFNPHQSTRDGIEDNLTPCRILNNFDVDNNGLNIITKNEEMAYTYIGKGFSHQTTFPFGDKIARRFHQEGMSSWRVIS